MFNAGLAQFGTHVVVVDRFTDEEQVGFRFLTVRAGHRAEDLGDAFLRRDPTEHTEHDRLREQTVAGTDCSPLGGRSFDSGSSMLNLSQEEPSAGKAARSDLWGRKPNG